MELIYLSYIRPLLEYGDILYDGCGVANSIKLNKVQYEAAKIVSGATHGTSTTLLLQDLGWESLSSRRERHKLCLFYELHNGNFPTHMSSILPQVIHSQYETRRSNYRSMKCHSFIPSSVRLWNALDLDIQLSSSLASFKKRLACSQPHSNKYYYYGSRTLNILHSKLRLNCAPLNEYLYRIGAIDNPYCKCGLGIENVHHFFFLCPNFNPQRQVLKSALTAIDETSFTLTTILHGISTDNTLINKTVANHVQKFIRESRRFKELLNNS